MLAQYVEPSRAQFRFQFGAAVDAHMAAHNVRRVILVGQHPVDLFRKPRRNRCGQNTARLKHAREFVQRSNIILDVLQHFRSDDAIE